MITCRAIVLLGLLNASPPPAEPPAEPSDPYELKDPVGLRPTTKARVSPHDLREPAGLREWNSGWSERYRQRSRRSLIAAGVLFGVASVAEKIGAGVAIRCDYGRPCALSLTYAWGSPSAGTRYTWFQTGPATPYVAARALAIPLIWVGEGLLLTGVHDRAVVDLATGGSLPYSRRLAWALFGTGVGLYISSRLARLGFALAGFCQDPACVYSYDILTLSSSRALWVMGSGLLMYQRTQRNMRVGVTPVGLLGLGVQGEF
jgi:hypothetical protein